MKRSIALVLALILMLSVAAVACNSTTGNNGAGSSGAITPMKMRDAKEENIVKYGTSSLSGTFNPILSTDVYNSYACNVLFSTLLTQTKEGTLTVDDYCLATAWELSDDKLTYTFTLRKDAKFHDGTPLTANDVKFTFEQIARPEYDGARHEAVADIVGYDKMKAGEAKELEGIKVIDDYKVSFTLTKPNVKKMWDFQYGILSKAYYETDDWDAFKAKNTTPMGSGPMMLDEWRPGEALDLVCTDGYYGPAYKIDGLRMLIVPNSSTIAALTSGQTDISGVDAKRDTYDQLIAGGLIVNQYLGLGYNIIGLNLEAPQLAEKEVRQALMYAWNRVETTDAEYKGFAIPCLTSISPALWAYPGDDKLNSYPYNPEKAKQMLDDAGWKVGADGIREKNGNRLAITIYVYDDSAWPLNLMAFLKEQWGAVGVELNTLLSDFATVMDGVDKRDFSKFDAWTQGWSSAIDPDQSSVFGIAATAPGGYNRGMYINEELDKLLIEGLQEYDQEKRAQIYFKVAQIINEDCPYLFNALRQTVTGVNPRLKGFQENEGTFYNWSLCLKYVEVVK